MTRMARQEVTLQPARANKKAAGRQVWQGTGEAPAAAAQDFEETLYSANSCGDGFKFVLVLRRTSTVSLRGGGSGDCEFRLILDTRQLLTMEKGGN